jgi:hypothetical protein
LAQSENRVSDVLKTNEVLRSENENLLKKISRLEADTSKRDLTRRVTQVEAQLSASEDKRAANQKSHQVIVDKLRADLDSQKLSADALQKKLVSENSALADQLRDSKRQFDAASLERDQSESVVADLRRQIAEMEELKGKLGVMELKQSELLTKATDFDLVQGQRDSLLAENTILSARVKELAEYYEQKENDLQISDFRVLLEEKDKTIEKLTKLVHRSRKADERKQQQIDYLQSELQSKIGHLTDGPAVNMVEAVARLESEIHELEARLLNSQGNRETEAKNDRLAKMLDRSNRLYSTLLAEHQALLARCSTEPRPLSFETAVIFETQTVIRPARSNVLMKLAPEDKKITDTYLKRVLLQFFLQDDATRQQLVPLILELVGCNEQQIAAAVRQWHRSTKATPSSSGFFGW